jgi:SecD/SecF fusion protein
MFPSRWKLVTYALVIVIGCLIAAPNLFTRQQLAAWPDWLPRKQVTLGLDLRGGSHLVVEIDSAALAREQLDTLVERVRSALREARIPASVSASSRAVVVRVTDAARNADTERVLRKLISTVSLSAFAEVQRDLDVTSRPDGTIELRPTEAAMIARRNAAVDQSLEIVRKRIDEVGVAEPTIQRLGADRILVQLPGVQDPKMVRDLLGRTAKLSFHRVWTARFQAEWSPVSRPESAPTLDSGARSDAKPGTTFAERAPGLSGDRLPPGYEMLPASNGQGSYPVERQPMLQGDRLADAAAGFDQRTGQPVVTFRFDTAGARRFAEITRTHVGEPFAIVLDGKVLSAPVIQEPITGGAGQISGSFSVAETTSLAALLRAGALPVPLHVIEERTVGPDLGSDAIRMGAMTGLAGLALVMGFMTVLYGRWGLVANLALLVNVALTFAALSLLGATLTLPGIAGIVLGIGLAVDANVLINERIREETRKGKSAAAALNAGFKRAYATIVDSNLTALIATALLFWFGSGPVRGFALTMALGIAISMFTAVSVVQAIMASWLAWRRPKQFLIEPLIRLRPWQGTPSFRYMRARFFGIGVSIVLSLASIGLFVKPGLNYGIDFVGGILIEAKAPGAADLATLRTELASLGLGEITLQEFGDAATVLVRIERQPGDDAAQLAAVDRAKAAIEKVEPGTSFERVEVVGPKISGELTRTGIIAVVLASLAMLFYIWFRFEWPFAVGAIATLVLDVTKVVGFFALTGLDFNLTAIAALLTLVGYSVNDKVVVYDRMRENMRLYKAMPLRDIIDKSINETLARSLYTSVTAFLAMLPMAIWGGSAVESFALPMTFGIVVAASSSIFIAAPILLFLGDWRTRRQGTMSQAMSVRGS